MWWCVYFELWWFSVNWEGSVTRDRLEKSGGFGRFAECNTQQTEELPSVKAKHSAKRPFSIILGTFFAECFGFDECIPMDTRQSDHKIWPLLACLPSVLGVTLGKVSKLCRVFSSWHSANLRNFAECFRPDTRQTWETLPSVFPSCTRKNRRHRSIPSNFFCREFIFAECLLTLGKLLFADKLMLCVLCRVLHSAKHLPSVFRPRALGKASVSRSAGLRSR